MSKDRRPGVMILTSDLGGGAGNHLLLWLRHLGSTRWNLRIFSEAPLRARVDAPVPVNHLTPVSIQRYPVQQILRYRQIVRICREIRPTVIHAYFFWSIIYARVLKLRGIIPALIENREDEGFNWNRHEYALLRLTRSAPDRVICVSEAVRRVVLRREGLPESRVIVIRNGVEAAGGEVADSRELRRELRLPDNALIVGMVANFTRPVKGVDYFLQAIPGVVAKVPNVRFLLVGRGKNETEVRARASELGADSHLLMTGFRKDIDRFYRLFDVSVLTSLSEGLSLTLLESMNHGVPVVATRVGGSPEIVVDGKTGYLTPPRDVEAFSDRVVQLLENPGMRSAMGNAARELISREFMISDVARRYADVYKDVVNPQV